MIAANELRIGNWVDYEATYHRVTGYKGNLIYSRWHKQTENEDDYFDLPENHNPIPLTDKIMLGAGFETLRHSGEYWLHFKNKNGWYISQWIADEPMAGFEEKGVFYWSDNYVPVHYLHELQNLFFVLNSKELEIKWQILTS